MAKIFVALAGITALSIIAVAQPAYAKLGEKAKSGISNTYKCQSGKMVRGKKGCKEYGGSN
jgi:hypothetical protein